MSLSAIGYLGVYVLGVILAFTHHPIFGLFTYLWAFYNHPSMRWWGSELPELRWSLIAALLTCLATLGRKADPRRPPWHTNRHAQLLMVFVGWMWIQTPWVLDWSYHLEGSLLFTKYLVLFAAIYRILTDERTLELFSWGHVAGCFILGWIAYRTLVFGRLESVQSPGVDDSNILGMHLATGLAFAGFMFVGLQSKRRWLAFASIPFILNTIILTASRGAFLGLLGGGVAALVLAPRAHRRLVYSASVLGLVLLLVLANDTFWDRIATIWTTTTEQEQMDRSALARLELLTANWQMALDYPLGAGHKGNEVLSRQYVPREFLNQSGVRAAHNTFLAALVDHGYPGALLFTAFQLSIFISLVRLRRLRKTAPPLPLDIYLAALGTSFATFVVCGQVLNLLRAEIQIWLVAMLAVVETFCQRRAVTSPHLERARARVRPLA